MHPVNFSCPHCSVRLRLQDRMLVGQQIDCPDCSEPLLIDVDGQDQVVARKVAAADVKPRRRKSVKSIPADAPAASRQKPRKPSSVVTELDPAAPETKKLASAARVDKGDSVPVRKRDSRSIKAKPDTLSDEQSTGDVTNPAGQKQTMWTTLKSPAGIAWCVAGTCAVLMIVAVWPPSEERPNSNAAEIAAAADTDANVVGSLESKNVETKSPESKPLGNKTPANQRELIEARFANLGDRLLAYERSRNQFPMETGQAEGLPRDQRFSWMAELAVDDGRSDALKPLWDRSWRDPLNDRFVRRSFKEFHNPSVKQLADPNRYPATHFVGMAGVGSDAAQLPVSHPRAGIFGDRRRTTLEDIKDGTSNTIMIAGIDRNLGAWAAAGKATIRAFTRGPYINGPDGFGSGQSDGMLVLMADGSVRFVSKQTAPTILRRMAAMSDGFPLDMRVAGEPGDPRPAHQDTPAPPFVAQAKLPQQPVGLPADPNAKSTNSANSETKTARPTAGDAQPTVGKPDIVVAQNSVIQLKPTPPKPIDVEAALAQKILRFEQSRAVQFSKIVGQLEEMAGVPIRIDEDSVDASLLQKPVFLKLQNTTIGDILRAMVNQVGLTFDIQPDGLEIRGRKSKPAPTES